MSDHADIVRKALMANGVMRYGSYERSNTLPALAALDALVAERDELRRSGLTDLTETARKLEAAEARVTELEAALAREKRASDVESEMLTIRYQAAEAEVARLREALAKIAEMYDGDIEQDGTESDAQVFAWADDFVAAHGIARAALGEDA